MQKIDYYIDQTINMENTSDGGSAAYHFDDVVLVKYLGSLDYSPRKDAEYIMQIANEKNSKGVRTPKHLAIKRITDGENVICWVLQEKAMGNNFRHYCTSKNKTVEEQLKKQSIIATAPDSHYEKLVSDLCDLSDVGTELKAKNIFYDENICNGGFTFIDLLRLSVPKIFDPNSLKDVLYLFSSMQGIYNATQAYHFDYDNITEADQNISKQIRSKIMQNIFIAMEKVIPNFEQHRRWVLRSIKTEDLIFFANNGTHVGNLSLNEQEYAQFDDRAEKIVADAIQKIETGERQYWQIGANEIRIDLDVYGMQYAWLYHNSNMQKIEDFQIDPEGYKYWNPELEYKSVCAKELENVLNQTFEEHLDILATNNQNPFIIQAKMDLDERRISREWMSSKSL